jgi:hypothetical protein
MLCGGWLVVAGVDVGWLVWPGMVGIGDWWMLCGGWLVVAGAGWEHGLETAVCCNRQKALKQLQVAMQHQICGEDHAPFDSWPVNKPSICSHVCIQTNSQLDSPLHVQTLHVQTLVVALALRPHGQIIL